MAESIRNNPITNKPGMSGQKVGQDYNKLIHYLKTVDIKDFQSQKISFTTPSGINTLNALKQQSA